MYIYWMKHKGTTRGGRGWNSWHRISQRVLLLQLHSLFFKEDFIHYPKAIRSLWLKKLWTFLTTIWMYRRGDHSLRLYVRSFWIHLSQKAFVLLFYYQERCESGREEWSAHLRFLTSIFESFQGIFLSQSWSAYLPSLKLPSSSMPFLSQSSSSVRFKRLFSDALISSSIKRFLFSALVPFCFPFPAGVDVIMALFVLLRIGFLSLASLPPLD